MRTTCSLLLFLGICWAPVFGQDEVQEFVKVPFITSERDLKIVVKDESIDSKNHKSVIARTNASPAEVDLIRTAEALYPDLSKLDEKSPFKQIEVLPENETEPYWSGGSFDGVKIALTISTRALQYYHEMSATFRSDKNPTRITMNGTSFEYSAKVERRSQFAINTETFKEVRVVTMRLSWSQYCGNLCAMVFSTSKIVVFGLDGRPVAMYIDTGRTWVS